ncbi:hypothetical protein GCM10022253_32870 [Sphingomonas endophytica]|uniref:PhiE125 gp8 family phage protein n=1 Tax=Sphingomonas endophytica TaxID=869719 RepID=A0A7X0JEM6_9SPHN|nr:hypothetical protein [Sphingomonas endophytica]MBB6506211.1 hypothetical protein [Sphingomonas endophytica]
MTLVAGAPGVVTLGAGDRALALAAVRAELRAATIDDDALALAFVEAALGLAEQFTGRVLIVRELVAELGAAQGWQALPAAPVRAIVADGVAIDIDAQGVGWVKGEGPLRVSFTAGLASGWAGLPAPLRQGVAMLAAHLFSDRAGSAPVPAAVSALWRPFRSVALAQPVHA